MTPAEKKARDAVVRAAKQCVDYWSDINRCFAPKEVALHLAVISQQRAEAKRKDKRRA